jgi:hypothetical protein
VSMVWQVSTDGGTTWNNIPGTTTTFTHWKFFLPAILLHQQRVKMVISSVHNFLMLVGEAAFSIFPL